MKIAIVHDYIKEYGGAEKVLETLHEIFPDASIYTSIYLPQFLGSHRKRFEKMEIRTSWLQHIPFKGKLISPFRVISPFIFRSFNFSNFDVVIISQTGAYFPNLVRKTKNQRLITYTHTPPRYLYGYKTAREWKNNIIFRLLGETANHFLRMVDYKAAQNVDYFIANSNEVKARIKKFYRRDAVVMYPPAVNSKFDPSAPSIGLRTSPLRARIRDSKQIINHKSKIINRDYYLTGGRLARAKGIDIVVGAFVKLGKPLKIFGRGFAGYDTKLKIKNEKLKIKDKNSKIEFLGEVSDEEKFELMRNTKAYIFASYDEDFGITPVEAMSVGTPVIAYRSGGVKETVIDGKTGILYEENTSEKLIQVVKRFEKLTINSEDCIKQAEKFSKERFKKEIKGFVASVLK